MAVEFFDPGATDQQEELLSSRACASAACFKWRCSASTSQAGFCEQAKLASESPASGSATMLSTMAVSSPPPPLLPLLLVSFLPPVPPAFCCCCCCCCLKVFSAAAAAGGISVVLTKMAQAQLRRVPTFLHFRQYLHRPIPIKTTNKFQSLPPNQAQIKTVASGPFH